MVETEKDLDVAIEPSFNPTMQCMEGFSRTRAFFFTMRRGFVELTPAIFRPLFLSIVLPQLDFVVRTVAPYPQKGEDPCGEDEKA